MLRTLFYLSLLLSVPLVGQSGKTDKAFSVGYGNRLSTTNMEPAENGNREQAGFWLMGELEFRRNEDLGLVGGLLIEQLKSRRASTLSNLDPAAFDLIHPYRSRLTNLYLFGGVHYNFRVAGGEITLGIRAGPGFGHYQRVYDVFLPTEINGGPVANDWGADVLGESSRASWRLRIANRLQYTRWFSKRTAVSLGLGYAESHYLGGGQSTSVGERYRFRRTGFRSRPSSLLFNVNYDNNTYSPDPSQVSRQLYLFIGISERL